MKISPKREISKSYQVFIVYSKRDRNFFVRNDQYDYFDLINIFIGKKTYVKNNIIPRLNWIKK